MHSNKMLKSKMKEKKIHLSKRNIFNLSKRLISELSRSQLIHLMGLIAGEITSDSNNHIEDSETFAESLELDTSTSADLDETTKISIDSELLVNSMDEDMDDQIDRVSTTVKEIIDRQCGKGNLSQEDNRLYNGNNIPLTDSEVNEILSNTNNLPRMEFIGTTMNFNNTVSEQYIFNPLCEQSVNKSNESSTLSLKNEIPCFYNDSFDLDNLSNLRTLLNHSTNTSDSCQVKEESNEVNETEIGENASSQFTYLQEIVPLQCSIWCQIPHKFFVISTVFETIQSASIKKRVFCRLSHRKCRSHNKSKSPRKKSKEPTKQVNIEQDIVPSHVEKVCTIVPSVATSIYVTDSKKDLDKLIHKFVRRSWQCTYDACKHTNSTTTASCVLCFNPRWNYHSKFSRHFFCSACGYVNYKTRVCCKKCHGKLTPKKRKPLFVKHNLS